MAGTQASVEWQVLQASLVGMWFVPLPVAIAPSWQLTQVAFNATAPFAITVDEGGYLLATVVRQT